MSPYLAALGLAVLALYVELARGRARLVWSPVFVLAGVFLATRALSLFAATDPAATVPVLTETAKDLVFLVVVTNLLVATGRLAAAARLVVAVFAVLAGLTLVQELAFHNAVTFGGLAGLGPAADLGGTTVRHTGPLEDANFWARALVLVVPLGLSLASHQWFRDRRGWWLAAVAVLCGGVYLSQSRGGLLALGVGVAVWLALAGRRYLRLLIAVPLLVAVLLFVPGVGSRLATLTLERGAGADPSLQGRVAAQQAGLAMFADHPALGVGAGNFQVVERDYQARLGIWSPTVLAAHNLYLEMAAESGLLGLAGWLLLYGGAVLVAARALILSWRLGQGSGPSLGMLLSAGVLAGLAAWAVASAFLHLSDFRTLLVVVALGAALDVERSRSHAIARRLVLDGQASASGLDEAGPTVWRPPFDDALPRRAAALVAVAALPLAVGLLGVREPAWTVQRSAAVGPVHPGPTGANAYPYELLSRDLIVPTYAAVMAEPRFEAAAARRLGLTAAQRRAVRVEVEPVPRTALITVSASSPDATVAARMTTATLDGARAYITSMQQLFVVRTVAEQPPQTRLVTRLRWERLALAVALCALAGAVVHRFLLGAAIRAGLWWERP